MSTRNAEHPLAWIARKQHKTHFRNRWECNSSPATNTGRIVEYEMGLGDALSILKDSRGQLMDDLAGMEIAHAGNKLGAISSLRNAYDHLLGKDIKDRLHYSQYMFEKVPCESTATT